MSMKGRQVLFLNRNCAALSLAKTMFILYNNDSAAPSAPAGSCAMGICEPCQVRKEAALSGITHVPQISLTGADGTAFLLAKQEV